MLEELSVFCGTPLGEDSWKLAPGFFGTLLHALFPFTDLVLHPFVIIHSCEYKCTLSLVSPASKSLNLSVVLRSPGTLNASLFSMNLNCHSNINAHIYVAIYELSIYITFNFSWVVLLCFTNYSLIKCFKIPGEANAFQLPNYVSFKILWTVHRFVCI